MLVSGRESRRAVPQERRYVEADGTVRRRVDRDAEKGLRVVITFADESAVLVFQNRNRRNHVAARFDNALHSGAQVDRLRIRDGRSGRFFRRIDLFFERRAEFAPFERQKSGKRIGNRRADKSRSEPLFVEVTPRFRVDFLFVDVVPKRLDQRAILVRNVHQQRVERNGVRRQLGSTQRRFRRVARRGRRRRSVGRRRLQRSARRENPGAARRQNPRDRSPFPHFTHSWPKPRLSYFS